MIKKHSILIGFIISFLLLLIASFYYPGGSQVDINSIGYDWKNNYLCNLFTPKAMNGEDNPSRFIAIPGMLFLCLSMAIFFFRISNVVATGASVKIIKCFGVASMLCAFLAATPYHNIMTTAGSTLGLVALFYITVFVLKSGLTLFKILCIANLAIMYFANYVYYSGQMIVVLPVVQKLSYLMLITLFLGLEYYTTKEDFQPVKKNL